MQREKAAQVEGRLPENSLLRYAALVECSDDAIIGKTLGGIITSWNPAAERIFGYRAEEIIGESILIIYPPDRVDEEVEILARVSRGERISNFETVRKKKNGDLINVSVTISPLIDMSGRIVGISKIARDISDRIRAEEEMRRQTEEYKLAFYSNPLPMWVCDAGCRSFLAANDEAVRKYGYSREEFLKLHFEDVVVGEQASLPIDEMADNPDGVERGTWHHRTKDGTLLTVQMVTHPFSFDGKSARLVLLSDITARRAAEEALIGAEHRYRATLDNMMEGCQLIDREWRYVYLNDAAARHGKKRKEDLIGRKITDVYPGIENTEMFSLLRRCMMERIPSEMENLFTYEDWTTGWFKLSIEPVNEGAFILSMDVTKEKQSVEELEKYKKHLEELVAERTAALEMANKELEAFSYSVSHDLRAPLRQVDGFARLLAKRLKPGADLESGTSVEQIVRATEEMANLIDNLLDFSRTARAEMKKTMVSVRSLVDRAILALQNEISGRIVEWEIGALPDVEADSQLLYLVVFNLLSNAVKYSSRRTIAKVSMSHRKEDTEDVFVVRDNGVGFDMQYAGRLFGVFQRLHDQGDFKGTGIGLANVRRIIARHGGRTWAEGIVGEGASFYFTLPAAPETAGG